MALDDDGVFEAIARANPDLAGDGPAMINLRDGDEIVSMPLAEFEAAGTAVGEAILVGIDFMEPWPVLVEGLPRLMAWAIAEGAYRYAVLRAFRLPPYEAQQVLKRASHFLYFVATIRPTTVGGQHG